MPKELGGGAAEGWGWGTPRPSLAKASGCDGHRVVAATRHPRTATPAFNGRCASLEAPCDGQLSAPPL